MKGVDSIKVNIKFIGTGYHNNNQASVKIYDKDKLIFRGNTYNGELKICLKKKKIYKLKAKLFNQILWTSIYINSDKYVFKFDNSFILNRTITLSLKDYYYNLPIKKGVIVLWQR